MLETRQNSKDMLKRVKGQGFIWKLAERVESIDTML
jgi:hypothetical protein